MARFARVTKMHKIYLHHKRLLIVLYCGGDAKKMLEYQVNGTVRKEKCNKDSPISHLIIFSIVSTPNQAFLKPVVIKMIEDKEASFWSFHYKNGLIDDKTKIDVVVYDGPSGKYLCTRLDETELNNLLELPIYHKNEQGIYSIC